MVSLQDQEYWVLNSRRASSLGAGIDDEAWPHLHHVEVVLARGLGFSHPALPLCIIHHLPCAPISVPLIVQPVVTMVYNILKRMIAPCLQKRRSGMIILSAGKRSPSLSGKITPQALQKPIFVL